VGLLATRFNKSMLGLKVIQNLFLPLFGKLLRAWREGDCLCCWPSRAVSTD